MKYFILIIALMLGLVAHSQVRYEVKRVHDSINTTGSETGAIVVDDSVLLYTTMMDEDASRMYLMDFRPMLTEVFQASIDTLGRLGRGEICKWGMNVSGKNCGNVAWDEKTGTLYFTRNDARANSVKQIYFSTRINGRWSKAKLVGGDINKKGYNSTNPAIGQLSTGETVLFFSSDRPGGQGGMDIWSAVMIRPGVPGNPQNLGLSVNTDSNEVTPFWSDEQVLYFSSNREGGKGGYDVYRTEGKKDSWMLPQTLGDGINTKFDDVFFTQQRCNCRCEVDSMWKNEVVEACGFVSSNRPGSLFASDSNCCNDLFRWSRLRKIADEKKECPPAQTIGARSALDLLPLSLYFHNDEPSPKTLDTTTTLDYLSTWRKYMSMKDEYAGAQPSPADRRKWDSIQKEVEYFFEYELRKGQNDLVQLMEFLYADLKAGKHLVLTVNGYASPLFESEYNVNISKRRIACLRNQLKHWNDEALLPFLNNGMLKIESVANGAPGEDEVAVTDPLRNPKSEKSVYSMAAARARRIDIIDYKITK